MGPEYWMVSIAVHSENQNYTPESLGLGMHSNVILPGCRFRCWMTISKKLLILFQCCYRLTSILACKTV